jgi:photosystem II stability/assembly factor-like uncharacterized protein
MKTFRRRITDLIVFAGICLCASVMTLSAADTVPSEWLHGLSWRGIGPTYFGGRVADIHGIPGNPNIIYAAHSSAGLFKSINGGITFTSVFDTGNTLSIGAIAVPADNPDLIYVGTGEGAVRNSISYGDGIYKSTDGGKTWTHCGLKETERFSKIVLHPHNPDIIYAAATGHAWGPNTERGIFRSRDGGTTWKKILYVNPTTGASDVAIDPENPLIIYAGMYDYLRQPWHFRSGGPGSGLYRSKDGGDSWTLLTDPSLENGLPGEKLIGRTGVSVSPADPDVVYAVIESQETGMLWRSDDRGRNWTMVNSSRRINNRPFYYSRIYADPEDRNRIYSLAGNMYVSGDGGRSFQPVAGYSSYFGDHHALWIDPENPARMYNGNDGGFYITNDRGEKWDFINNMPMAQAYHVGYDMDEPYHVMGGFQDHEIWVGPNELWNQTGVRGGDWTRLRYMADGMYAFADPRDSNIIYYNGHFGDITRIDMRNKEERYIQPYPVGPTGGGAHLEKYRFNWNSPVIMSPHNPDIIYYGGNVLFKTTDGGQTWTQISPDLTTDDPEKMKLSGGPITPDNTRAEFHCTILTVSESPVEPGVIWTGTDDGNLQLTRNGGRDWANKSGGIPGFPREAWISCVDASPHKKGKALVAVDQHRLDDFKPHVFMTEDYGRSWTDISSGLESYVHVIREDPRSPGLLYAGTELGIFVSFDNGDHWTDLRLGLPPLPVRDIAVHPRDNDLILATHARGFFILDDISPLQGLSQAMNKPALIFPLIPPVRYTPASDTSTLGDQVFVAPNQPYGALISYFLSGDKEQADILIRDSSGQVLRTLEGTTHAGINRVVWDLREDPRIITGGINKDLFFRPMVRGFRVLPGDYTIQIETGGLSLEQTFHVRLDPHVNADREDLALYERSVRRLMHMMMAANAALAEIRRVDEQLDHRIESVKDNTVKKEAQKIRSQLLETSTRIQSPDPFTESLNLRGKLNWLLRQVRGYTGRPTDAQEKWIGIFEAQEINIINEIKSIFRDIQDFNRQLQKTGLAPVQIEDDLSWI